MIRTLPKSMVQKIAAGEVVERPASVVKELIENAIDAQAQHIEIQIEKAGLKKIQVTDDGHGMSRRDIQQCFLPHTTSKVATIDDLLRITSMGFRGEALASIAAVASVTIKSKTKSAKLGTEVSIVSKKVQPISDVGMPHGTIVTVSRLFSAVPARKRFLKTPATEFRHIVEIVSKTALAFPAVGFVLKHNGKTVIDVPAEHDRVERITAILGRNMGEGSFAIDYQKPHMHIQGVIGSPAKAIKSRARQYLFINNRPVTNEHIARAVKDAFGTLLPARLFPIFVLFITLPPDSVDVNVHPRKEEVKLLHGNDVAQTVTASIKKILDLSTTAYDHNKGDMAMADMLRSSIAAWDPRKLAQSKITQTIQQLGHTYLMHVTDTSIMIIDQHAAHERILYEQLRSAFETQTKQHEIHALPVAATFDMSVAESAMFDEQIKTFHALGFAIEPFGGTTYKVSAVPKLFAKRDAGALIREMLQDVMEQEQQIDSVSDRTIAYIACRTAVKAGDTLTPKERKDVITKLANTPNNATCPHGRPTYVELTIEDLHKAFKRT